MSENVKFIRKNGRLIPIRDKSGSGKQTDKQKYKEADKDLKRANKVGTKAGFLTLASAAVTSGIVAKKFGSGAGAALGALAGLGVGRMLANGIYGNTERMKENAITRKDEAHENMVWEKKKKAYAKMDKAGEFMDQVNNAKTLKQLEGIRNNPQNFGGAKDAYEDKYYQLKKKKNKSSV